MSPEIILGQDVHGDTTPLLSLLAHGTYGLSLSLLSSAVLVLLTGVIIPS